MAGVTPITLGFWFASSTNVLPNTSWYFGGCGESNTTLLILPVILSNIPGACQSV